MKNLKNILSCLLVGFAIHASNAQVTNTGLPVSITNGLKVYIPGSFTQSGTLTNEGILEVTGDLELTGSYSGTGTIEASGAAQDLDLQSASITTLNLSGGDKTLTSPLVVENLDLINARLITSEHDFEVIGAITGADASSHIVGKLIRSGTDPLVYPIGRNANYAPVTLSNITGTDPKIAVELFETNPLGTAGKGLLDVSNERYWGVTTTSGVLESTTIELSILNELLDGSIEDLVVARGNAVSGSFTSLGQSAFSGDLTSGAMTSATTSGSGIYTLGLFFDESLRVADSTALVSIYENAGGESWLNNSGWLSESLDAWSGVGISQKRVAILNLSGNNLQGEIPEIPEGLESIEDLNLRSNELIALPDLTSFSQLTNLEINNNKLEFASIEPNIGINGIQYSPQGIVGTYEEELFEQGQTYEVSRQVSGSDNTYSWFKEDKEGNITPVASDGGSSISLPINTFDDEGLYFATVTNAIVTDLELTTEKFFAKVSSLERDRLVLMELFEATDGTNWTDNTSWGDATVSNAWSGVTVDDANSRVTRVELPENGLIGSVPASFADIAGLNVVDLSNNEINEFPDVSGINGITSLNISQNKLFFKDIIPNIDVGGINYFNQKRFGETLYDTLSAGLNSNLETYSNIDFGTGSVFQWNFGGLIPGEPFNNAVSAIEGATDKSYTIENIDIESQGTYRLSVTHPEVSGLILESRNQNILAETDFFGSVSLDGDPVIDAEIVVWRKTPTGPFVREDSTQVDLSGDYLIENVVLGTFVVVAKPNRDLAAYENTIQTYFVSEETYEEADPLNLVGVTEGIDIDLISFEPFIDDGSAIIGGVVESEFEDDIIDEEGGRVTARRKVKKAGCAMRRFKAQGRPDQDDEVEEEIAYYVETDDEGFFNFSDVADGKYLLSIEFPGVPIDDSAEVVFEIGGDRENQIFDVNVLITEAGIEVDQDEILFNKKPYVKDVVLYPNPTEGVMALDYLVYRDVDDLKLQLVSTGGIILQEQEIDHWKGNQRTEIDLRDHAVGVYHLVFTDEAGTFAKSMKIGRK